MLIKLSKKRRLIEIVKKRAMIAYHQGNQYSFVSGAAYTFQNGKLIKTQISQQIAVRNGIEFIHNSITRV